MKLHTALGHSLALALMLGAAACPDDSDDPPGPGSGNGDMDMGPADTGDPGDMGPGDGSVGEDMMMSGPCYLNITTEPEHGCPSGEVCNLITGECVEGTPCTEQRDCDGCAALILSDADDCGHGAHVAAVCSEDHGNVCVRSRANCEPCETDADCGLMAAEAGFLSRDRQIACVQYEDGNSYCAHPAQQGCPRGYEANQDRRCVNPRGCEDLFFCDVVDTDEDGVADENVDCDTILETQCFDEVCEGSGGLRCTGLGIVGVVEVCADYCKNDQDCIQKNPDLPFCERTTGVCKSGCTPGQCDVGQVCNADGNCGAPCEEDADCDEIEDPAGLGTYCNLIGRDQLPRKFKDYHDANSCQQLGCELGPGENINRDCDPGEACDPFQAPFPDCVPGCYRGGPFVAGGDCQSSGELGSTAVCVDAQAGDVQSKQNCRNAPFLGDENREVLGSCCDPGCLTRGGQCGPNRFCCGEVDLVRIEEGKFPAGPFGYTESGSTPEQCTTLVADQPDSGQAGPGDCFEPANQPFCQTCDPGAQNPFAACNRFPLTNLVPDPNMDGAPNADMYVHSQVWSYGLNTLAEDTQAVNAGQPFPELQACVDVDPAMGPQNPGVCSVSFDPAKGDPGAPNGWECRARTAGCFSDAECGGLECVGEDPGAMPPVAGACRCGEGGEPTAACPTAIGNLDMGDSGRMRCVERGPPYLVQVGSPSDPSMEGDFFCVYSYDCRPPTFTPMDGVRTYPLTCGVQETL
jgi:hypothetical protein